MIGDRNLMSHTYDFAKFEAVIDTIRTRYLPVLENRYFGWMEDLLHYDTLKNARLKGHIDRVGIVIFACDNKSECCCG
ncbi:hypothetical protein ABIE60_002772 [Marinobacterium sp. MBR-109]|jgi:hypothetical protein